MVAAIDLNRQSQPQLYGPTIVTDALDRTRNRYVELGSSFIVAVRLFLADGALNECSTT